jgi:hypothetical protein
VLLRFVERFKCTVQYGAIVCNSVITQKYNEVDLLSDIA